MKTFFIAIIITLCILPAFSEDLTSLSAIELNSRGYRLYEKKQYEASLPYFETSFKKNPDYVYPHFNYACVLSLLQQQGVSAYGDEYVIREHLIIAASLDEKYFTKWRTDPDLKWFRDRIEQPDSIWQLDAQSDPHTLIGLLLRKTWYIGTRGGIAIDFIRASFTGTSKITGTLLQSNGPDKKVTGSYRVTHNLVYIKFEEEYPLYEGAFGSIQEMYVLHTGKDNFGGDGFVIIQGGGGCDYFSTRPASAEGDGA